MTFNCNRCPKSYPDFTSLVRHYENEHSKEAAQMKALVHRLASDDMGCPEATAHLGYQSFCLQCPFPKCLSEKGEGLKTWEKRSRNEKIRQAGQAGKTQREMAEEFGVGVRTIQRAISSEELNI